MTVTHVLLSTRSRTGKAARRAIPFLRLRFCEVCEQARRTPVSYGRCGKSTHTQWPKQRRCILSRVVSPGGALGENLSPGCSRFLGAPTLLAVAPGRSVLGCCQCVSGSCRLIHLKALETEQFGKLPVILPKGKQQRFQDALAFQGPAWAGTDTEACSATPPPAPPPVPGLGIAS